MATYIDWSEEDDISALPVRDDLLCDPACETRLFELLAVLQHLSAALPPSKICRKCDSYSSDLIVQTCRSWLDDDDNTDFPLNPRAKVTGVYLTPESEALYDLRITTSLSDSSLSVAECTRAKIVLDGRWFRDACERFIRHVPCVGEDEESALANQKEGQLKLWYLLLGKWNAYTVLYDYDLIWFASNHLELLDILVNSRDGDDDDENGGKGSETCQCEFWPSPSPTYPTNKEDAQNSAEFLEHVMNHLNDDLRDINNSALKDKNNLPRWLNLEKETDRLLILHALSGLPQVKTKMAALKEQTQEASVKMMGDWFYDWTCEMMDRDIKEIPEVPTGSEHALKAYEVIRMARIVADAVDDLGFGDLLEGGEDSGRDRILEDVMDVDGEMQQQEEEKGDEGDDEEGHVCTDGNPQPPVDQGRYYE